MLQPLVIVALLAGPGAPPTPAAAANHPAELERALRTGRPGALARLGRELAAAGLRPLLTPGTLRLPRLAAIEASVAAPDAPLLLGALARLAASADRRVAASAARAAVDIAGNVSRSRALELDLAPADLANWGHAWMTLAAQHGRWVDVRVHALEVAAALDKAMPGSETPRRRPFNLGVALGDVEPQVRRAALELVPLPVPEAVLEAVTARLADDDPTVALAAAQAICAGVPLADGDAATAAAAAWDRLAPHQARIRTLLDDPGTVLLPGAALDIARCLVAAPASETDATLRKLLARVPAAARPELLQQLERRRRGAP